MQYGKAISDAFSYARHSKAGLLYAGFTIGVALAILLLTVLTATALGLTLNPASWLRNATGIGVLAEVLISGFVIYAVGSLAVTGTVIRNATNSETLTQSWKAFSPRLGSMLGVAIIASVISFASSMLLQTTEGTAFSGLFFAIHLAVSLALAFFLAFAEYAVVLEGKKTWDALHRSIALAREKPVDVLLALIVSTVTSLALALAVLSILILLVVLAFLLLRVRLSAPGLPALTLVGIAAILAVYGVMVAQVIQLHIMANAFRNLTGASSQDAVKEATKARAAASRPAGKKTETKNKIKPKPAARRESKR